jgi:hypothetical protein
MAKPSGRKGCGCCGCLLALFVSLLALLLVGAGFSYFFAANNPNRAATATTGRVPLPATSFSRQTYTTARQKFDRFFANPAERTLTLSNAEVNALLAESPELRLFQHGIVVAFDYISAQVYCSVPLDLPFLPRRYLNCSFETRPSMHGAGLELDISRIERDGKPLGAAEVGQYRVVIVPLIEKFLSSMNKTRGDRAVRDLRIENGNLVLAR